MSNQNNIKDEDYTYNPFSDDEKQSIGDRLMQYRLALHMSRAEMVGILGLLNEDTYGKFERGVNVPTIRQLKILHDTFGLSIDNILFGIESASYRSAEETRLLDTFENLSCKERQYLIQSSELLYSIMNPQK